MNRTLSFAALVALGTVNLCAGEVKTVSIGNVKRYSSDLLKTVALYKEVFGLELTRPPSEFAANVNGQKASGTTGSLLRSAFFKLPGLALQLEPLEYKGLDGHPLQMRKQSDIGDQSVLLTVKDLDVPLAAAKKAGMTIVTTGGQPITRKTATGTARGISLRDFDGHMFHLIQPSPLPEVDPSITGNVIRASVEITVEDLDKTLKLYRDGLGLEMADPNEWQRNEDLMKEIGVESATDHPQHRTSQVSIGGKRIGLAYIEFKGVADRKKQTFRQLDPGGSGMSYQVTDLAAALKIVKENGGEIMGASPVMNENGGGTGFVRTPNGTLMEMSQPAPGAKKQ